MDIQLTHLLAAIPVFIYRDLGGVDRWVWFVTAHLLTTAAISPFVGRFSDVFGRRWVALAGSSFIVFGQIMCGVAENMDIFIGKSIRNSFPVNTDPMLHTDILPRRNGSHRNWHRYQRAHGSRGNSRTRSCCASWLLHRRHDSHHHSSFALRHVLPDHLGFLHMEVYLNSYRRLGIGWACNDSPLLSSSCADRRSQLETKAFAYEGYGCGRWLPVYHWAGSAGTWSFGWRISGQWKTGNATTIVS